MGRKQNSGSREGNRVNAWVPAFAGMTPFGDWRPFAFRARLSSFAFIVIPA